MKRLLILADDFTGALDTGVQFASRGARTCVVTDPAYDFSRAEEALEVLVLDAETRHLPPGAAYRVVHRAVQDALAAGFSYIYKKTDSALRGNIGSELAAVLDGAGAQSLAFIPALPHMRRITRDGIHYIDQVPVARSVFGQDPFEPVTESSVERIIAAQTGTPVVLHRRGRPAEDRPGIQLYDAETQEDLAQIGGSLADIHLTAGCAGFAPVLAELLELQGAAPVQPALHPDLLVACGSVNPVTLRQLAAAEAAGFPHIHLTPEQKLEPSWLSTPACDAVVEGWLETARQEGRFLLDVNDPAGRSDTGDYARRRGLTTEDLRIRISAQLGKLIQKLLDGGLEATLLCTGGDTLLALTRAVGVAELIPLGELDAGAVLTAFVYRGRTCHIIAKSGGFGEPDLFVRLSRSLKSHTRIH